MDVCCPACAARYTANDDKLRGRTARMRCKACHHVWLVSGPSVVKETLLPPQSSGPSSVSPGSVGPRSVSPGSVSPGSVGARNETSVLFSLDQLAKTGFVRKATTPAFTPGRPLDLAATTARRPEPPRSDDEGVIDLRQALTAPPPRFTGSVPPLFSEPAGMAVDVHTNGPEPLSKSFSKGQLFGGLAAAAVLMLVATFGIALTFRGEEPVTHAAVVTPAEPPAPKLAQAPAPVAPAQVDTTDTSETKDEARAAAPTKKAKGKKGHGAGRAKVATWSATATPAPAPARKPVKAADPCRCKGNFDCILACTARGGK